MSWWLVFLGIWALCFAYNLYEAYRERRSFSPREVLIRAFLTFLLPFSVVGVVLYAIRPPYRRK